MEEGRIMLQHIVGESFTVSGLGAEDLGVEGWEHGGGGAKEGVEGAGGGGTNCVEGKDRGGAGVGRGEGWRLRLGLRLTLGWEEKRAKSAWELLLG